MRCKKILRGRTCAAIFPPDPEKGTLGIVHNIGGRPEQQDSLGWKLTERGLLAVVSDGMGGLEDGALVSGKAVEGMLAASDVPETSELENPLYEMFAAANTTVLNAISPSQIYKSGATFISVLANEGGFHWVAVGDSRIYLYTNHHLLQINREHIYEQELIAQAVNGRISFASVKKDPQKNALANFLGMGELKYVDGSRSAVRLLSGDKLLLMSDGIFKLVSEPTIIEFLENSRDAADAASLLEKQVLRTDNGSLDNFTCMILDF